MSQSGSAPSHRAADPARQSPRGAVFPCAPPTISVAAILPHSRAHVQPRTGRTQRRKKRPARRSGREWYDDAQKTRKRRRSAEHAASGPQLTPEVPPPRAGAVAENSIPCSVRNVNNEFGQISHFQKPQMSCPPALTFRAPVIYCFWQERSPCYPAFSAFAVARLRGEGSCFCAI